LLDVRRDDEVRHAAIPGSLHIPMHELRGRLGDVPREKPVVVLCHLGERSLHVTRFLIAAGMNDVYNLEGGIDAYSRGVDPSIPRY
jgi:rhodanese-related sulfurtransferase